MPKISPNVSVWPQEPEADPLGLFLDSLAHIILRKRFDEGLAGYTYLSREDLPREARFWEEEVAAEESAPPRAQSAEQEA